MQNLLFINPEIRDGLNVTVRNGTKWATAVPGDLLSVRKTGKSDVEQCQVRLLFVQCLHLGSFAHTHALVGLLRFEHDSTCQTWDGLDFAMRRAYGDDWGPEVTVLGFVRED